MSTIRPKRRIEPAELGDARQFASRLLDLDPAAGNVARQSVVSCTANAEAAEAAAKYHPEAAQYWQRSAESWWALVDWWREVEAEMTGEIEAGREWR